MKKILVTGGCGYIGSHTIVDLIDNGYEVISVDSNIRSNADILKGVEKITGKSIQNYVVDLCDLDKTKAIFDAHPDIQGIIHFAAFKSVKESVGEPLLYFQNNINSLLSILTCVKEYNIPNLIFSSSCSVYGNATELPVTENTPFQEAESPYARTKQIGEQMIRDFSRANPKTNSIILRYFNPAGAHESGEIGEISWGSAIYLVPVITDTAVGRRDKLMVFGDDYDTRDGSCIRDFIHIMDLANAHTKSLAYLLDHKQDSNCEIYNLGIGDGTTVLEAVRAFEKVAGQSLNYEIGPRRPGDVVAIYSDYNQAKNRLGWSPKRNIEDIMRTAWTFEQKNQID